MKHSNAHPSRWSDATILNRLKEKGWTLDNFHQQGSLFSFSNVTALMCAVRLYQENGGFKDYDLVQALLEKPQNINTVDNDGCHVLWYVADLNNITPLLIEKGLDLNQKNNENQTFLEDYILNNLVTPIGTEPFNTDEQDPRFAENIICIQLLIANGATIDSEIWHVFQERNPHPFWVSLIQEQFITKAKNDLNQKLPSTTQKPKILPRL